MKVVKVVRWALACNKLQIGHNTMNAQKKASSMQHRRAALKAHQLTDHEVELVLRLVAEGLSYRVIAAKMEISKTAVGDYVVGRRRAV